MNACSRSFHAKPWMVLFLFLSAAAFSQPSGGPPSGAPPKGGAAPNIVPAQVAKQDVAKLADRITFTTDEKDSLLVYFTAFYTSMKAKMESGSRRFDETLVQERDAKVQALLDTAKYLNYVEAMKSLRPTPPAGGRPSRKDSTSAE